VRKPFPGGNRFAFTIIDDTDVATVENVRPFYRLLESLGMRTTKTVWPVDCPEGSRNFFRSKTLADGDYLEFVRDLHRRGFEITWHGATMESSTRERTIAGLQRFNELLGFYPRVHAGHAENRENLYWGINRVDDRVLRTVLRKLRPDVPGYYCGDDPQSPYWWGDVCQQHFTYGRNLTFNRMNVSSVNPSMPYVDPRRPLVPLWFSASDAEDLREFAHLLRSSEQDRLEREGGVCIVATHLGKGFVENGAVDPAAVERLTELAGRSGWFVPVGDLLDYLASERPPAILGAGEWRRMQWQWMWDLAVRRLRTLKAVRRTRTRSTPYGEAAEVTAGEGAR
jgi:hypothetical protein